MSDYALTPLAKAVIFDIWSYIADDSEDAANRVEQTLTRYPNYTVVYRPETPPFRLSPFCTGKETTAHTVSF